MSFRMLSFAFPMISSIASRTIGEVSPKAQLKQTSLAAYLLRTLHGTPSGRKYGSDSRPHGDYIPRTLTYSNGRFRRRFLIREHNFYA